METLPLPLLLDILTCGRLRASDLASLEAASAMFRTELQGFKSLTELAAHRSCAAHPVFQPLPPEARAALLARCEGDWKLVLHFLQSLQRSSGRAPGNNNVLAYECRMKVGDVIRHKYRGWTLPPATLSSLPAAAKRIVQISAKFGNAAFVTESGQVYTFGTNTNSCCGLGDTAHPIPAPTLVNSLDHIPIHQVATGKDFTLALTTAGCVFSWGWNKYGQLGQGHTSDSSVPRQIQELDSIVEVCAGIFHALAVTRSGRLFSWGGGGNGALGHSQSGNEVRPREVALEVFVVSAAAGDHHSAAIASSGQVYTWGTGYALGLGNQLSQRTPRLVTSLNGNRAVQVVARGTTFVLLDTGTVYCFGLSPHYVTDSHSSSSFSNYAIVGHKVQSIVCGRGFGLLMTKKGGVLGFGYNAQWSPYGVVSGELKAVSSQYVTAPGGATWVFRRFIEMREREEWVLFLEPSWE